MQAGFAAADVIVENTYRTPFQEHAFLEPEVGLAWIDENEVINIRVSTQVIEHFRAVADALGVPHNKVRMLGAMSSAAGSAARRTSPSRSTSRCSRMQTRAPGAAGILRARIRSSATASAIPSR